MWQRERDQTIWQFVIVKTNGRQFFMRLSCYWHWILSQHCQSSLQIHLAIALWIHSYSDNVMMKFMINNRTGAWKTEINLLIRPLLDHSASLRVLFNWVLKVVKQLLCYWFYCSIRLAELSNWFYKSHQTQSSWRITLDTQMKTALLLVCSQFVANIED